MDATDKPALVEQVDREAMAAYLTEIGDLFGAEAVLSKEANEDELLLLQAFARHRAQWLKNRLTASKPASPTQPASPRWRRGCGRLSAKR